MTVSELIEILRNEDQDRIVICQKDAEGNGYSPLHSVTRVTYVPDSTWSGEVRRRDGDYGADAQAAIVLEPVN